MEVEVTYMSGAGNIFSVIDNRKYRFSVSQCKKLAPIICKENFYNSKQTEGLLVLNNSKNFSFEADFFNPDGSTGVMCGNGARCAVSFTREKSYYDYKSGDEISFFMCGNKYKATYHNKNIKVFFPPPIKSRLNFNVEIDGRTISASYVNVGSEHLVINQLRQNDYKILFNFDEIAPKLRSHPDFMPNGVNVNFYSVKDGNTIELRTYERGVEGETGACGTGTISTAIVAAMNREISLPVTIIPTSGIPLKVDIIGKIDVIEQIILEGPAEIINEKIINIPDSLIFESR